jgi:hypothetical protein
MLPETTKNKGTGEQEFNDIIDYQIYHIDINELKTHPNNPRERVEKAMNMLEKSLKDFGNVRPLLINHQNEILDGNQRFMLAKSRNIKTLPCLRIKKDIHLSIEQEQALIILLNQNSLFKSSNKWDCDILANNFNIDYLITQYQLSLDDFDPLLGKKVKEQTNKSINFKFDFETCESLSERIKDLVVRHRLDNKEELLLHFIEKFEQADMTSPF